MEIGSSLHSLGELPICPAGRNNWWAKQENTVDFYKGLEIKLYDVQMRHFLCLYSIVQLIFIIKKLSAIEVNVENYGHDENAAISNFIIYLHC